MAHPRFLRALAAIASLAILGSAVPAAAADGPPEPVIVLLHERQAVDVDAVVERAGRSLDVRPTNTFQHALKGFATSLTPGQARRLAEDPSVEAIVPDSVVELADQRIPSGVRRIGAVQAPATKIDGRDGSGERIDADVAIIDTGIQRNHPDLNVVGGKNCVPDGTSDWADKQGHGTHVAGTVGALDNGYGVVGSAPGVRLWSVRVFDPNAFSRISWIVCGIDWVTAQRDANDPDGARIDVANMSLRDEGGDDGNCGYTTPDAEHRAICKSVAAGTTYVVAAGNDRTFSSKWRPASYNEVITVSAIADFDGKPGGLASAPCTSFGTRDVDDTFADFSNYGKDVDITAPGVCVYSTLRGSGYGYSSGTSMAAPVVAGAAAVYKALHPVAPPAEVRSALVASGNHTWRTSTDRDTTHEPLLDMSSFGAPPGFTLHPTPGGATLWAGYGRAALDLKVTRGNGFNGDITLSMAGVPEGISATLSASVLRGWSLGPVRLEVRAAPEATAGTWNTEIVATSGDIEVRRPYKITVRVDATPPTTTQPRLGVRRGTMSTSAVPLRVYWSGSDADSGVVRYDQQEQRNGGSLKTVSLTPVTATSRSLTAALDGRYGGTWVERVRATDLAGNVGEWTTAPTVELVSFAEGSSLASYSGGWTTSYASSSWGGKTRYATAAGASMTLTFRGRSVGWVTTKGPSRGKARVYVDGTLVQTVDLYSSTTRYRQVVFTRDMADATRKVKIVVLGTSGRPRVDVDGFLVIRRT